MSFGPRLCDRWQKESKDIENETAGLHVPTGLQLTASKHIEDQLAHRIHLFYLKNQASAYG